MVEAIMYSYLNSRWKDIWCLEALHTSMELGICNSTSRLHINNFLADDALKPPCIGIFPPQTPIHTQCNVNTTTHAKNMTHTQQ
jgi:hypothetical protein